jgi:nickel transport system substrate-binding protein
MKNKLLLTLLALVLVLAGCGAQAKQDTSVTPEVAKDNSLAENQLTIAWSMDLSNFGPLTSEDGFTHDLLGLVYEPLFKYDGNSVKPCLAESYQMSEDGKEYTFKLREDISFSDGSKLDANAVKLNMDGVLLNKERFSWMGTIAKLTSVETVSDYEIKFTLDSPYYGTLYDLTAQFPMRMISPNSIPDDGNTAGMLKSSIGTGKYILSESKKDQEYVFTSNENYWGEKAEYDKIIVKIIPDHDSRILALQTGEIDMIFGSKHLSYEGLSQFDGSDKIGSAVSDSETSTRSILMNAGNDVLSDINLRRAIQYATNKQSIIDNVIMGLEKESNSILNPSLPYCDVNLDKDYSFNQAKAIEFLEKSGWILGEGKTYREKDGQSLSLGLMYVTSRGAEEDMARIFADQMKQVGIEVKLDGVEAMVWGSRGFEGDFQLTFNPTFGTPYDPHNYISGMLSFSLDNIAQQGLENKAELDQMITELSMTTNEEDIQEYYSKIINTLMDSGIYVPISYEKQIALFNKEKIKNIEFGKIASELIK